MNSLDAHVFFEEIFGIIEPALEQAGYHVLEGDTNTHTLLLLTEKIILK